MKKDLLATKRKVLNNANKKIEEALLNDYPLSLINTLTDSVEVLRGQINGLTSELEAITNEINLQQTYLDKEIKLSEQYLSFKYLYSKANLQEKKALIKASVDKIIVKSYEDIKIIYKF